MQHGNHQVGEGFSYTYSAKEQAEIKRIREKYTPPTEEEDTMARLRRLDASVTNMAQAVALIFGVLGTLLLGLGMSFMMTELAALFGTHRVLCTVVSIAVGVLGGTLASLAYPVYNVIVKEKRKKLAPEILRLTDELMK